MLPRVVTFKWNWPENLPQTFLSHRNDNKFATHAYETHSILVYVAINVATTQSYLRFVWHLKLATRVTSACLIEASTKIATCNFLACAK